LPPKSGSRFLTPDVNKNRWFSPAARPLMPAIELPYSLLRIYHSYNFFDRNERVKIVHIGMKKLQYNQGFTETCSIRKPSGTILKLGAYRSDANVVLFVGFEVEAEFLDELTLV
jgi:hypothetical protein